MAREGTHLVIADVVITFVGTLSVRTTSEGFTDILNVRDAIYDGGSRPISMTLRHRVKVNLRN